MEAQVSLNTQVDQLEVSSMSDNSSRSGWLKVVFRYIIRPFKELNRAWLDTTDLCTILLVRHDRRKLCVHIGSVVVLLLAISSCGLIVVAPDSEIFDDSGRAYCTPGGNFNLGQSYNPWASEHILQITLGFGKLTFAEAKAIDVVWDVVVGRGGQFLLAAISFLVFSKALYRMLEQPYKSIKYDGFRALIFERPTLSSIFKLVQDVRSMQGWQSKASIVCMVIASIYVVAFPTIAGAMTGYISNSEPYFIDGSGKIPVPEFYFHRAIYRIQGADRIEGMTLNSTYIVGSRGFGSKVRDPDHDLYNCRTISQSTSPRNNNSECGLLFAIQNYTVNFGSDTQLNVNTTLVFPNGTNYNVRSPVLNITSLDHQNSTISTAPKYTTENGSEVYNADEINKRLGTYDNQPTYRWGFSFILLFFFFVTTAVWMLGMYAMWVDSLWNSRLACADRQKGFYRGVVDVSNAMWKDTLSEVSEMASESKIKKKLKEKLNGGRIKFDEINHEALPQSVKERFNSFKQTRPILSGWTKIWTLLHWTLSFTLCLGSVLCMVVVYSGLATFTFSTVLASLLWLKAGVTLLMSILTKRRQHIPVLGTPTSPTTASYWIQVCFFASAGASTFFLSIMDYFYFALAYLLLLINIIMWLVGLPFAVRRWIIQPVKISRSPLPQCKPTQTDTRQTASGSTSIVDDMKLSARPFLTMDTRDGTSPSQ